MLGGFHSTGFTITEMLAVVAIIIVVLGILLPTLASSRESSKAAQCGNNEHQIGIAFRQFAAERKKNPNASQLLYDLGPYLNGQQDAMYKCPKATGPLSYGVNPCVQRLQGESNKVILLDAKEPVVHYDGANSEEWLKQVAPRHYGHSMNVLYYDGHVTMGKPAELNPYTSTQILDDYWKPKLACNPRDPTTGGGGCGCTATYYTGQFAGTSATRIDPTLHMPFGGAFFGYSTWNIPLPNTNAGGWDTGSFGSGVWRGQVRADKTEDYTFAVACDNEVWVYVGGAEILHRSTGGVDGVTAYQDSMPIPMVAGQWVTIEVRLLEATPGFSPSHVSLKWKSPSTPLDTVSCANLKP
jgi:prepilin-type processing-associated H-X9-DG protein